MRKVAFAHPGWLLCLIHYRYTSINSPLLIMLFGPSLVPGTERLSTVSRERAALPYTTLHYTFPILLLLWACFCTMYEHVVVEHLLLNLVLQYREHSTAQQCNQPAQSRKASTYRSGCDNASKQSCRESVCRGAFIQHAELSKRTKKSKSTRPTQMYNYSRTAEQQNSRTHTALV